MDKVIKNQCPFEILEVSKGLIDDKQTTDIKFKLSVQVPDRSNEIVIVNGINLENYKKNPIVLWNHDSATPPIGTGKDLYVENGILYGTIQFHNETLLSKELSTLTAKGVLSAVSIGFMPLTYRDIAISEELINTYNFYPTTKTARIYDSSELVEFSLVSVPANQEALVTNALELNTIIEKVEPMENLITKVGATLNKSNATMIIDAIKLLQQVLENAGVTTEDPMMEDPEDILSESLKSLDNVDTIEEVKSETPNHSTNKTIEYITFDSNYEDELLNKLFRK